jgi:hypothetical protein
MRATLVRKKRRGLLLRLIGAESYRDGQSRLEELERIAAESRSPDQWIELILGLRDEDRIGDLAADYLIDRFAEGAVDRLRPHDDVLRDLGRQVDEYYQKEARDRAEDEPAGGPSLVDDDDVEWDETGSGSAGRHAMTPRSTRRSSAERVRSRSSTSSPSGRVRAGRRSRPIRRGITPTWKPGSRR